MDNKAKERLTVESKFSSIAECYIQLMHLATYNYALQFVKHKTVLDFGCGSGYGSKILSESAAKVDAVDISDVAVLSAKKKYPSANLNFSSLSDIDIESKKQYYDVITSFQVIEHIKNA